jgi:hypothetical protein
VDILHDLHPNGMPELGEPFDTRLRLLLEWDEVRKSHHRSQVAGNPDETYALSWAVTEAHARVDEHAKHLGNTLILSIRLAGRLLTAELTAAFLDLPLFQHLIDGHDDLQARVADLEIVVGGSK